MLDSKIIRERLISDLDCKESQVDGIVEKIQKLAPEIYTAFEEWFNTGKVSDIAVEGFTVESIRTKKKQMNVVGAFLALDWLKREPQKAKFALNQQEFQNSAVSRGVRK
ncbi:MAG: hypothetical protein FWH20_10275 [Oscillospiraceae bacterium]|nr:hypothetical protein [Oscillospiraceae bacterium]